MSPSYAQKANFSTIDLENDLDISSVSAIASSSRGYLYLANNEQVYVFDGKNADPVSNDYSLPFSELSHLQEDSDGDLYLLSNAQIFRYGEKNPVIKENARCFRIVDSLIFYGTESGLKVYSSDQNLIDRPVSLEVLTGIKINNLAVHEENLLIACDIGFYVYNLSSKTLENFNTTSNLRLQNIKVSRKNEAWTYDDLGTIAHIDLNTKKVETYSNKEYSFTSLETDSRGNLWFGSSNKGILYLDTTSGLWKTLESRAGLVDNRVLDIHCDRWGFIWIVTADGTLSKFIDKDYELYNVYDGLPTDAISSISIGPKFLLGVGSRGIYELRDNRFYEFLPLVVRSEAILQDSSTTWIGTSGNGLIRIENNESTVFGKNAGLPSAWIKKLVKDGEENIWIGTPANGLVVLSPRDSAAYSIRIYGEEEGVSDLSISALIAMKDGRVFYGTSSGKLGVIASERTIEIETNIEDEITDLVEGPYGSLYIGTAGSGIWTLANEKGNKLTNLDDYPANIKSLVFLEDELYAITDKGIITSEASFLVSDGFPSSKLEKSQAFSHEGRIWIASKNGLISLGPLKAEVKSNAPIIFLENVEVNYSPIPIQRTGSDYGRSSINYNENQISFDYEGVNIHSNKDVQYSYILEGRDKLWSPWSKNDNPSFNNLRAGEYVFKVKAKSDTEAESDIISHAFVINGPLWKKWWFIPAIVMLLSIIALLLFRARLKRVKRKNEEEKAQLEMKNKLLELEQKANQLQMNPHFIFNALNSIQATVAKERFEEARKEITDFAALMRSILANSKERIISLEDELRLLQKYIHIEKKCRALDFVFILDVDDEINEEEAMIPPMLIQPFIENAIVHGLKGRKEGELKVSLSLLNEDVVEVRISDNGIGYHNSKKSSVRKKHKSVAIEVTKERLETLLDKKFHPPLTIDQISEEGGTLVVIKIPVEYNF